MNKICTFFLILLSSVFSQAQDAGTTKGKIAYGVKAGGQVTANYGPGTNYYAIKPFMGFHVGVFGNYGLSDKLSIQPEMLLTGRGIRAQYATDSREQFGYVGVPYGYSTSFLGSEAPMQRAMTTQTDVYYLDLPVTAQYEVMPGIKAHAGIMYSAYLFKTKLSNTYISGEQDNLKQPDQNYLRTLSERGDFERFEKHQFGILFGGSYQFDFGLQAGARYNVGLTRINKPVRGGHDLRYSMFQIFAAYDLSRIF